MRLAGGVPIVLPVTTDDAQIDAMLSVVDALVMTGGEDFDPLKWYGEEPRTTMTTVNAERDEFDVKLLRAAVAKGIPVLGICRGEQALGVAFGGALQTKGSLCSGLTSSCSTIWSTPPATESRKPLMPEW